MSGRIWYQKLTWVLWVLISLGMILVPAVIGTLNVGGHKQGFPFTYHKFSSAPPPFFGSTYSPECLILNLVIYYLAAVGLVFIYERIKKH